MSGKQRRLRAKRRAEIKSKHLKRIKQSMNAKYGKPKLCYPIRGTLMLDILASKRFHATETRLTAAMIVYNELRRRSNALLEGS